MKSGNRTTALNEHRDQTNWAHTQNWDVPVRLFVVFLVLSSNLGPSRPVMSLEGSFASGHLSKAEYIGLTLWCSYVVLHKAGIRVQDAIQGSSVSQVYKCHTRQTWLVASSMFFSGEADCLIKHGWHADHADFAMKSQNKRRLVAVC